MARRLRKDVGLAGARIVALSGYGGADDHRRSKDAGFALHLVKPLELEQIRQLLEED